MSISASRSGAEVGAMRPFPTTTGRVARNTRAEINRRIAARTEANIRYHARRPERIGRRLRELDAEWDIERMLEANAATIAFTGTALGLFAARRWLAVPLLVTGFLFQHATQGWCPPLSLLRRLGVRTAREIAIERFALKALRGDFAELFADDGVDREVRASKAIAAVRA
jgi:hypothetical protein